MSMIQVVAETTENAANSIPPIVYGGSVLAIFLIIMIGLLMFGKGREHA